MVTTQNNVPSLLSLKIFLSITTVLFVYFKQSYDFNELFSTPPSSVISNFTFQSATSLEMMDEGHWDHVTYF